jgi:3-oxoadipate enol-lactonase
MPFLVRENAKIYYEISGDLKNSKVITLVNGHTRSSTDFRMMARVLEAEGIASILMDNRGAGKTEVNAGFTISDFCDDVVSIWDECKLKKSALLGISMGGFISQGITIKYPDRVDRLILVSSAPEERFINPTGGGWITEGQHIENKMRKYFAPGFTEKNPVLFENMVAQIRKAVINGDFSNRSDMQRTALQGASWTKYLNQIVCPTLIVHGAQDRVIEFAAAKLLHKSIPGSRLEALPNVGHLLLAEAPKDLYKLVIDFIKNTD